jgi:hypothetical protein
MEFGGAPVVSLPHPAFREQGYATTAVSTLTEIALERTFIPQYRTLEASAPSMVLARRLGFVDMLQAWPFDLPSPIAKVFW